jgi:hypothetical protein
VHHYADPLDRHVPPLWLPAPDIDLSDSQSPVRAGNGLIFGAAGNVIAPRVDGTGC